MSEELPVPDRKRWTVLRAGIVDLWEYDSETFVFHRGRLLLRGRNESGKSKTLELWLPFLLDGRTLPERLGAERDKSRLMYWNLFNDHNPDRKARTGYVWMELGKLDGGVSHIITLGCGLRASRGGAKDVTSWFFRTRLRVGEGLDLGGPGREALSRKRLPEVLGDNGVVYDSGEDYRQEVNRRFYGMEMEQYDALIDMLLELRRPKLSKNLDVKKASAVLSESLPPLDSEVVGRLASDFDKLEEYRRDVEAQRAAALHVKDGLEDARRYVRLIARQRSDALIAAHNQLNKARVTLRDSDAAHERAKADILNHDEALVANEQAQRAAEATRKGLKDSESYRGAEQIDSMTVDSERQAAICAQDEAAVTEAASEVGQRQLRWLALDKEAAAKLVEEDRGWTAVVHEAGRAEVRNAPSAETRAEARTWPRFEGRRRRDSWLSEPLASHRELCEHWDKMESRRVAHEREQDAARRLAEALYARQQERDEAQATLDAAAATWRAAAAVWFAGRNWSHFDSLPDHVEDWRLIETTRDKLTAGERLRLDEAQTALAEKRGPLAERAAALSAEITRLEAETHTPPPSPAWRRARVTAGAPLYLLCTFADSVSPEIAGAIEGALLAAGVLDAWVTPDGQVETNGFDRWAARRSVVVGPTLRDVLDPVAHDAVPETVIDAILRSVPLFDGAAGGAGDGFSIMGEWQVGVVFGRNTHDEVRYIGEAARAGERARQLAKTRSMLDEVCVQLETIEQQCAALRREAEDAETHRSTWPERQAVDKAEARRDAANIMVKRAMAEADRATRTMNDAEAQWLATKDEFKALARSVRREGWVNRLDELKDALDALANAIDIWLDAARDVGEKEAQRDAESEWVAKAEARLRRAESRCTESRIVEAEIAATLNGLVAAMGASAKEVRAKIAEVSAHLTRLVSERRDLVAQRDDWVKAETKAQDAFTRARDQLPLREHECGLKRTAFDEMVQAGMIAFLSAIEPLSFEAGAPPATLMDSVELARAVVKAYPEVDVSAHAIDTQETMLWKLYEHLKAHVPHEYQLEMDTRYGIRQIIAHADDEVLSLVALEAKLRMQLEAQQSLLAEDESRVLAEFLTGATRRHLRDRLVRARELIEQTNKVLAGCPTPGGKEMRLKWDLAHDAPPSAGEAVSILLRDSDAQTLNDRESLESFFTSRLAQARDEEGSLRDRMLVLLDYRRWHEVELQIRTPEQRAWRPLTRKVHGAGSGGEKAVLLHLPLFAAAAAFYESAKLPCPRLVLMDEAFAGVDQRMTAELMGLLCQLELDFVLTAFDEWGCYSSVDGLSIYDLSRESGLPGVLADHYVWDGHKKTEAC